MRNDPSLNKAAKRRGNVLIALALAAVALSAYLMSALQVFHHGIS